MPSEEPTQRQLELEAQLTQLQRHVEQQDREMFAMGERIRKLEAQIKNAREKLEAYGESKGASAPADERPPHW